jgi:hypothetical protein
VAIAVAAGPDDGRAPLAADAQEAVRPAAERMAFTAPSMSPSVPFLKPTGVESPDDISRWVCDSEVRAPMAVQAMRSP